MFRILLSGFLLCLSTISDANDLTVASHAPPEEVNSLILGASPKADWFFSGRVHNENNIDYDYFFKIQQHDHTVDLQAALISVTQPKILLFEQASTTLTAPHQTKWQAGKLFLNYNVINNRWVLGAHNAQGVNFNFKIDMFAQKPVEFSKKMNFKSGVHVIMNKTGQLNGHIKLGQNKEEFVSQNSTWVSHIWLNESQKAIPLSLLLCDFDDEQGFFTMKSMDKKIPHTFSYWRDAQGKSVPISQFLNINRKDNALMIQSVSPKMRLHVDNLLPKLSTDTNQSVLMGRVNGYKSPGFCVQNDI